MYSSEHSPAPSYSDDIGFLTMEGETMASEENGAVKITVMGHREKETCLPGG